MVGDGWEGQEGEERRRVERAEGVRRVKVGRVIVDILG
jgi:hypothetical protein